MHAYVHVLCVCLFLNFVTNNFHNDRNHNERYMNAIFILNWMAGSQCSFNVNNVLKMSFHYGLVFVQCACTPHAQCTVRTHLDKIAFMDVSYLNLNNISATFWMSATGKPDGNAHWCEWLRIQYFVKMPKRLLHSFEFNMPFHFLCTSIYTICTLFASIPFQLENVSVSVTVACVCVRYVPGGTSGTI